MQWNMNDAERRRRENIRPDMRVVYSDSLSWQISGRLRGTVRIIGITGRYGLLALSSYPADAAGWPPRGPLASRWARWAPSGFR